MTLLEKEYISKNIADLITVRSRLGKIALSYERNNDRKKADYYASLIQSANETIKYFSKRMIKK